MKKKFVFLLIGEHYTPEIHQAAFETDKQISYIYMVKTMEAAFEKIKLLKEEGVGAIELCGAFGVENTKKIIALTNNEIAIGYVTHLPEQDDLFAHFFIAPSTK